MRVGLRTLWKLKMRSNSHTLPKYLSSTCKRHVVRTDVVSLYLYVYTYVGHTKHQELRRSHLDEVVDHFQRDQLIVALLDARHEVQAGIPLVHQLPQEGTPNLEAWGDGSQVLLLHAGAE